MITRIKKLMNDSMPEIKKLIKDIETINSLENTFSAYSDVELQEMTRLFKERIQKGATVGDLKHEAFAVVREAAKRVLGLRPYDVQLMGGLVLLEGNIAQMQTGEGKTLVATLPSYLHALFEKGVHIITANEYLAKRDRELMGQIHEFLGLQVGLNISEMEQDEKMAAYSADITYGTGTEFGFDYLRDNMVSSLSQKVQREHYYAIVDEVDSILIDEARTPLIIANKSNEGAELFTITAELMKSFKRNKEYEYFPETRQVYLTDEGATFIEKSFGIDNLYNPEHKVLLHHVTQSLKAQVTMQRDVDYIIKNDKIELVDQFTGRVMEGRSFSEGLHQAIEAKEGVTITEENETQATITIQNYFRMYANLSGMTGSATPSKREFVDTYRLHVITIPTNKENIRIDYEDEVYETYLGKVKRIIEDVRECAEMKRPVLIGTTSIEQSERLSKELKKAHIPHRVLNAKTEEDEARIIANAGQKGSIILATNMAGRGTDILLDPEVRAIGGLHIIGTERHESKRIDMQLRGRAGRQGDPGTTRFIISLEDDLFHYYDEEEMAKYLSKVKTDDSGKVVSPDPIKFVKKVQETVENAHFTSRNHLLKLDSVLDQQSKTIYAMRDRILTLENDDIYQETIQYMDEYASSLVDYYLSTEEENRNQEAFIDELKPLLVEPELNWSELFDLSGEEIKEIIIEKYKEAKERHLASLIEPDVIYAELKGNLLYSLDLHWNQHLQEMNSIKEGIMLHSYGQIDPYQQFEKVAFSAFKYMIYQMQGTVTSWLLHLISTQRELMANIRETDDSNENRGV